MANNLIRQVKAKKLQAKTEKSVRSVFGFFPTHVLSVFFKLTGMRETGIQYQPAPA